MGLYVAWLVAPVMVNSDNLPGFMQMSVAGTPVYFFAGDNAGSARLWLFLGLLLVTQWAFLRPMRGGPKGGTGTGRTQWAAIISVAFMTMLLSAGFLAVLLELPNWWVGLTMGADGKGNAPGSAGILVAMLGLWLAWAWLFYVYWKQGDYLTNAGRVIGWLIRGSCLELLMAIPAHAWAYRRQGDCYCALGTYTGLVFGFGVLFWAFGPGLMLLFLREKSRRAEVLQRLCPKCGALLGVNGVCDQCGPGGV
jgi:hypothetical protein